MNHALISPNELVYSYDGTLLGERIAETAQIPFEVALPLFWIECADEVSPDYWYYQTETLSCQLIPYEPDPVENLDAPETIINVDQTIS